MTPVARVASPGRPNVFTKPLSAPAGITPRTASSSTARSPSRAQLGAAAAPAPAPAAVWSSAAYGSAPGNLFVDKHVEGAVPTAASSPVATQTRAVQPSAEPSASAQPPASPSPQKSGPASPP